jgi:hypothetical protein
LEGNGVEWEKTFTGIIENRLKDKNIEVLNAGVSSYAPRFYFKKVQYLIEEVGLRFD